MPGTSRESPRTRATSLLIPGSSAVVCSTHVTWEPRIPPLRQERERKISQKRLEGIVLLMQSITALMQSTSYHINLNMDTVVTSVRDLFAFVTGIRPNFRAHGGTAAENLALQNIQVETACVGSLWCAYKITRPGCVWFFRTCSLNSFLGLEVDKVDCLCWVVPTLMRGKLYLLLSVTESDLTSIVCEAT